jgi:hypothetical protein
VYPVRPHGLTDEWIERHKGEGRTMVGLCAVCVVWTAWMWYQAHQVAVKERREAGLRRLLERVRRYQRFAVMSKRMVRPVPKGWDYV